MGRGHAVERCRYRLDNVPRQGKLAVPQEVLADRNGKFDINACLVTGQLLVIVSRDIGAERNIGGQIVQLPVMEELHALVFLIDKVGERLEGLSIGRPAILHATPVIIGDLIHVLGVIQVLLVE